MNDPRNPGLSIGDTIAGFQMKRTIAIEPNQIIFYELEHLKTGAKHIHLSSEDRNNFFMAIYRTLPQDSTGVAHILEHAILEGSRRYPVKTYKNLTGRSLNTFLNAMTSADYTAFPIASCNVKDFFNLLDLFLDATLYPLLQKEMFLQEGWRYEFENREDPTSPLQYKGVVYNEMKGAMGNPLRLYFEHSKRAIFPDLIYRHVSGGDPSAIPSLSYEAWVKFHRQHYHPSNGYFITYGNISLTDILTHIETRALSEFDRIEPVPPIPFQANFESPRRYETTYPLSQSEETANKYIVAMTWKLSHITEVYENLKLSLLNLILTGDTSSLLNRELLSSGLGGGLAPGGLDTSFSETTFRCGLKDTCKENIQAIEDLVIKVLSETAANGISGDEVDAGLHQLEFYTREIKGDNGVPFGLTLASRGLEVWIHGGDFLSSLAIDSHLERLRAEAREPHFFKDLIEKYLLKNDHRSTLVMIPESGGMERMEAELRAKLDAIQNRLTPAEKKSIIDQSLHLLEHQNLDEDLTCLPHVNIKDVSTEPLQITQKIVALNGKTALLHPVQTNGISYLTLAFDCTHSDYQPDFYDSLLKLISDIGSIGCSYAEMGRLKNLYLGKLHFKLSPFKDHKENKTRIIFQVTSKCLPQNHKKMFDLLSELIYRPDPGDAQRFGELVGIQRSYAVPMALYQGHWMAKTAAERSFSRIKMIQHRLDGLGYVQKITQTSDNQSKELLPKVLSNLSGILNNSRIILGLTSRESDLNDLAETASQWISTIPAIKSTPEIHSVTNSDDHKSPEAWIMNTEISYVAQAFKAPVYNHPDAPVFSVLAQLMEIPLYDRIRAKGGAYGVFAQYDAESGLFSFSTYRDPHTVESLTAFREVIDEIASGNFTDEQLEQAIIETIRQSDVPPSPRERGVIGFIYWLVGKTYETRKKNRLGILNVKRTDIERITKEYLALTLTSSIAMVTSDEILKRTETRKLDFHRIPLIG